MAVRVIHLKIKNIRNLMEIDNCMHLPSSMFLFNFKLFYIIFKPDQSSWFLSTSQSTFYIFFSQLIHIFLRLHVSLLYFTLSHSYIIRCVHITQHIAWAKTHQIEREKWERDIFNIRKRVKMQRRKIFRGNSSCSAVSLGHSFKSVVFSTSHR